MASKKPPTKNQQPVAQIDYQAPEPFDAALDAMLGEALNSGWDDAPPVAAAPAPEPVAPEYPPLPVREYPVPDARSTAGKKATIATNEARAQVSALLGLPSNLTADQDASIDEGDLPANKRLLNIGMLSDLATSRMTPQQAADTAGVTLAEMQQGLATELAQIDPKEIAKAMGIQAAQEQLKAGALFGAVVNDLIADMVEGRLTPQLKLQLLEMLGVIGRIKPKEDKSVGAGGGFILNISVGNSDPKPVTIEAD